MLALQFILADGITIRLGSSAWTFAILTFSFPCLSTW